MDTMWMFLNIFFLEDIAPSLVWCLAPTALVRVTIWPRTVSGKVDLKALPEPVFADAYGAAATPPQKKQANAFIVPPLLVH
jgi:hypothetical protein